MSQYLVTYQDTEQEYTPPYSRHETGGYHPTTVYRYVFVDNLEALHQYSKKPLVRYYEVAREIKPVFEVKTSVTLV
jgi:hypothetical protein